MRVLGIEQSTEWDRILAGIAIYDFYHTAGYHALAQFRCEGIARLFVYEEDGIAIALPLLLRAIDLGEDSIERKQQWLDATSVYGYAGPVASVATVPEPVVRHFQSSLESTLHEMKAVSVFSRLHPLIPQEHLLNGLGDCQIRGRTVSIDLTLSLDLQKQQIRRDHRKGIKKLREMGMTCLEDKERRYLPDFLRIYTETMHRVGANSFYFFAPDYFEKLLSEPGAHLFVAKLDDEVAAVCIVLECRGILQDHLGGTASEFLTLGPAKLLKDFVRCWGTARGLQTFHLGGGVSGGQDDLFYFKSGFSNITHPFSLWRWILNPDAYRELSERKERLNSERGYRVTDERFFPLYRAPAEPV